MWSNDIFMLLQLISTIPIFLFIADGYYEKDLKRGIVISALCFLFVVGGTILIKIFKLNMLHYGIPLMLISFFVAYLAGRQKK